MDNTLKNSYWLLALGSWLNGRGPGYAAVAAISDQEPIANSQ